MPSFIHVQTSVFTAFIDLFDISCIWLLTIALEEGTVLGTYLARIDPFNGCE
jgi:hypothetical protein